MRITGARPHYLVEEGQLTSIENLPGILGAIAQAMPAKKKRRSDSPKARKERSKSNWN
jgi:hypothetical protein